MDGAREIRIGTSGFSYKEWLGGFYPPKLPRGRMRELVGEAAHAG